MEREVRQARHAMVAASAYVGAVATYAEAIEAERLAQERVTELLKAAADLRHQGRKRRAAGLEAEARCIATAFGE